MLMPRVCKVRPLPTAFRADVVALWEFRHVDVVAKVRVGLIRMERVKGIQVVCGVRVQGHSRCHDMIFVRKK
jgi:hypothetical protein